MANLTLKLFLHGIFVCGFYCMEFSVFVRNEDLRNIEKDEPLRMVMNSRSVIECAAECTREVDRVSFAFDTGLQHCYLYTSTTYNQDVSSLISAVSTWKHYDLETSNAPKTSFNPTTDAYDSIQDLSIVIDLTDVSRMDPGLHGKQLIGCWYGFVCDGCNSHGNVDGLIVCCPACTPAFALSTNYDSTTNEYIVTCKC